MILVLLVEDYPATQAAVRRALRSAFEDCEVEVTSSARDAIALLDRIRFDLVVSDYHLADGSKGSEVLDHLRRTQPDMPPRFVFFSSDPAVSKLHSKAISKDDAARFVDLLVEATRDSVNLARARRTTSP